MIDPTLERRFWAKVEKTDYCWVWTAAKNSRGYGTIAVLSRTRYAHRVSYWFANGAIPDGFEIDHKCRNRACVNPDHLRAVTSKQNKENTGANAGTVSGVRGVRWHKAGRKWDTHVFHNGKRYSAGLFSTVKEAEVAVIALRNRLFTHNDLDRKAVGTVDPAVLAQITHKNPEATA